EKHWQRAKVDARFDVLQTVYVRTENVDALTLAMPPGLCPFDPLKPCKVSLDGTTLEAPPPLSDRSWAARFRKKDGQWQSVESHDDGVLRKGPSLQGPIDDAFMDRFL